jgi:hypothetical protein
MKAETISEFSKSMAVLSFSGSKAVFMKSSFHPCGYVTYAFLVARVVLKRLDEVLSTRSLFCLPFGISAVGVGTAFRSAPMAMSFRYMPLSLPGAVGRAHERHALVKVAFFLERGPRVETAPGYRRSARKSPVMSWRTWSIVFRLSDRAASIGSIAASASRESFEPDVVAVLRVPDDRLVGDLEYRRCPKSQSESCSVFENGRSMSLKRTCSMNSACSFASASSELRAGEFPRAAMMGVFTALSAHFHLRVRAAHPVVEVRGSDPLELVREVLLGEVAGVDLDARGTNSFGLNEDHSRIGRGADVPHRRRRRHGRQCFRICLSHLDAHGAGRSFRSLLFRHGEILHERHDARQTKGREWKPSGPRFSVAAAGKPRSP